MKKLNTAIIMCAGFGKRLKPLTNKVPKPLLKIDNKSLLENTIELLFRLNINKIFLNSHHLSQQIKRFILEKKLSKKIKVFEEKRKILNTGGGILNIVKSSNDKNYLVLNPDTIWTKKHSIEIIKMKNLYFSKKASNMLLVVKKKRSFDKRLSGDFSMKKNILTYNSKKEYIFTGCQIINRDLFINIKKKIFPISLIWNKLLMDKNLYGYESKIKFKHVTDIKIYKKLISKSIEHFCRPKVYPNFLKNLIKTRSNQKIKRIGCTDSSDGLFQALQDLASASKCKAIINYEKIPKDKDWPTGDKWDEYYFFGGEDYELVFSLPKKWAKNLSKLDKDINEIGFFADGEPSIEFNDNKKNKLFNNTPFKHF